MSAYHGASSRAHAMRSMAMKTHNRQQQEKGKWLRTEAQYRRRVARRLRDTLDRTMKVTNFMARHGNPYRFMHYTGPLIRKPNYPYVAAQRILGALQRNVVRKRAQAALAKKAYVQGAARGQHKRFRFSRPPYRPSKR